MTSDYIFLRIYNIFILLSKHINMKFPFKLSAQNSSFLKKTLTSDFKYTHDAYISKE